jgi:hypothetical protein
MLPSQAFGAKTWEKYFEEVGAEPPLSSDMDEILGSACPFWEGKVVKDTHLLVLIPARVAGEPFSLNLLEELIECPQVGDYSAKYRYYNSAVQEQLGAQSPGCSYWGLTTRDVLEGSRRKTYKSQQALVARHVSRTGLPSTLEAATVILLHYVCNGRHLYTYDPGTWTRCQDLVAWCGSHHPAIVGGFFSGGLYVISSSPDYDRHGIGVASLRKF